MARKRRARASGITSYGGQSASSSETRRQSKRTPWKGSTRGIRKCSRFCPAMSRKLERRVLSDLQQFYGLLDHRIGNRFHTLDLIETALDLLGEAIGRRFVHRDLMRRIKPIGRNRLAGGRVELGRRHLESRALEGGEFFRIGIAASPIDRNDGLNGRFSETPRPD